jgi:hypothetical protein
LFEGKWIELKKIILIEVSQKSKVMFSLICGSYAYKLNVYINTYITILYIYMHMCIYTYTHTYTYNESDNKIVLVGLSEGTTGGWRGRQNVRE